MNPPRTDSLHPGTANGGSSESVVTPRSSFGWTPAPATSALPPRLVPSSDQHRMNEFLDAIFLNSAEAIVIADGAGAICYATAGAMLLTGRDTDSMLGLSVFDFLHEDDVAAAADLFVRRLEYDGSDLGHEIRLRHATGDWLLVMATASLLPADWPGVCAITIRPVGDAGMFEESLRARIVVSEYANRLSGDFVGATNSEAVLDRIRASTGEIGLLTGAEVVEVVLAREQLGAVEQLAQWVSASCADVDVGAITAALHDAPEAWLLAEEHAVGATDRPGCEDVAASWSRVGIHSMLSVPFLVGEQRGVVILLRVAPGPNWTAADAALIRSAAGLYGRALHTARSEELLALTYRHGPVGFSIRTWEGKLVDCNQRYLDVNRTTRTDAERQDIDQIFPDRDGLDPLAEQFRAGAIDRLCAEVELVRGDGSRYWAQINAVPLHVPGLSESLVLIAVEDVTETHDQKIELEYAARHDSLTGLANRAAMTAAIERCAAADGVFPALLFIDLDRFKFVNDSLGHIVGDELLRLVADRILSEVRSEDVVARLGGDEFAIVIPRLTIEGAHKLARRLRHVVDRPFSVDGRSITQSLSIGIAMGEGSHSWPDLLVRADRALYAAKTTGRSSYFIYDESLEDEAVRRLTIERELRTAVASDQFEVYFQPEFDLADGHVLGAEALLRWIHPERGVVPADEFITVAEQTGLIDDIGRFALRQACRSFRSIPGAEHLMLRVNISAREFARPELPHLVRSALADSGLAPDRLCLEMTETTLMDAPEIALDTFARLHSIGVQSAIDDFGTGYSSLAYLKRFPVDAVKIDRTFVDDIVTDPDSRAIVSSIMGLSEALALQAVAEGVETVDQLEALRDLGCWRGQGYLVARPLPPEEFAAFIAAHGDGRSQPWSTGYELPIR